MKNIAGTIMRKKILTLFRGAIFGKFIGVIRVVIFSAVVGTSPVADAFNIGQVAFLSLLNLFVTDVLNSGFIPLYSTLLTENKQKASALLFSLSAILFFFSLIFTAIGYTHSLVIVKFIAPGLNASTLRLASTLFNIFLLSCPFYLVGNLLSFALLSTNNSVLLSLRSSFQSAGLVLGLLVYYLTGNVAFLVVGFFVSYFIYFCFALYLVLKNKMLDLSIAVKFSSVSEVLIKLCCRVRPLLFLPIFLQFNFIAERIVGSYLGAGVIAATGYVRYLTDTLVFLVGTSIGLAVLSDFNSKNEHDAHFITREMFGGLLVFTLPFSCLVFSYSNDIINIVFMRGAFSTTSLLYSSEILRACSVGVLFSIVSFVLLKILNAHAKNSFSMFALFLASVGNILFNFLAYKRVGIATIGYGFSIFYIVQFIMMVSKLNLTSDFFSFITRFSPVVLGHFIVVYALTTVFTSISAIFAISFLILYWLIALAIHPYSRRIFLKHLGGRVVSV